MQNSSRIRGASYVSLLFVVIIGAGLYFYVWYPRPCAQPITYRIGVFDSQFGISSESFASAIEEGSSVWEKALGKELFLPDEKGKLIVNLIYDERQAETQEQQVLEKQIDRFELTYQEKLAKLKILKSEYEHATAEYEILLEAFKSASIEYQSEVVSYNRRGGASKSEYERFTKEKEELLVFQRELESKRLILNAQAVEINELVTEVNALAKETNQKVEAYNKSDLIGVEFDQGLYVRNAQGISINIYQFTDRQKLVRVLAHEFGHALGLDHNQNPESIMYEFNEGETDDLSADDLVELKELCRITSP